MKLYGDQTADEVNERDERRWLCRERVEGGECRQRKQFEGDERCSWCQERIDREQKCY